MSIEYQKPKLVKTLEDPTSNSVETHPAYAQIGAARVQGRASLYGSDFTHQHFITIWISSSELHRGLSQDWFHARKEYIEVSLSEAQWATFVSSLNVGAGTRCTLTHLNGERVPQLPNIPDRKKQFKEESARQLQDALTSLKDLQKEIEGLKLSAKAKKDLQDAAITAERRIESSLPFVADQFDEHMENTVEKAKIEVNAYINSAISRAGLKVLQGQEPIKLIGEEEK